MDTEKAKVEEYPLKGEYYIEGGAFVDAQEIPEEGKQRRRENYLEGYFIGVARDSWNELFILNFVRPYEEGGNFSRFTVILKEREGAEVLLDILRFYSTYKTLKESSTLILRIRKEYTTPSLSYRRGKSGREADISPYDMYKGDFEAIKYTVNSLLGAYIFKEDYERIGADLRKAIREAVFKPYSEKRILGRVNSAYKKLVDKGVLPPPRDASATPEGK